MKFKNYIECIDFVMERVKEDYLSPKGKYHNGMNLKGMNVCYATDPNWYVNIKRLMNEIFKSDKLFLRKKYKDEQI